MIDKKEILILDYISEYESPIFFFWRKDIGELFNKPSHNLGLDGLARHISKLWMDGLIQIEINDVIVELQPLERIVWWLTHEHVLQSNVEEWPIVMLTDSGGELWEDVFKPNWQMYMTTQEEIIEKESNIIGSENIIIAVDKQRLISLIDRIENEFKHFSLKNKIIEIKPFFPVYWKQLESGFQVKFFMTEKEELQYDELLYQSYRSGLITKYIPSKVSWSDVENYKVRDRISLRYQGSRGQPT